MKIRRPILMAALAVLIILPEIVSAQTFGRNKPRYRTFDFKVYETPNYEIYHYLDDKTALNTLALQSEIWYDHIQMFADDTIAFKNPIVMFNSHGDFQQTNTISSTVGVSTGGVTEAFKNRVTMPFTMSNQKTFQVLGHELVHAFQYDIVLRGDSTSIRNLANLPLFIVEGMAEYLTRGRVDPFTAMWMRDIVLNDKVPEVKELANPKYFPYRYGQAFWAIVNGIHGDEVMAPLFRETAKYGLDIGARRVLGLNMENLTNEYQNSLKTYYTDIMGEGAKENFFGRKILDDKNAGNLNISPSVSPDGKYLIFLSEKGLFTTDLYLAETANGKIVRKIASTLKDGDIDNLSAFESAGSWSPDSKQFIYVTFSKGRNKLVVKSVDNAKETAEYFIKGVDELANPAWSPDGKSIVFSGLKQGQCDLYQFDFRKEKLTQLTNDVHSDIMADWSKDGSKIVFATDRLSQERKGAIVGEWKYNLAEYIVETGEVVQLPFFPGADNLNPNYDENNNIWFLSDRDGYRNIYKYEVEGDSLFQMTNILTGVCGITPYSPALAVSKRRPRVVFNHYYDGKYLIYSAREASFLRKPVDRNEVDFTAGTLPVVGVKTDFVKRELESLDDEPAPDIAQFEDKNYKSKLQLDFIDGSAGVGVGIGSGPYNNGLVNNSGVTALFSDMLGDHQLISSLGLNGEVYDASAIVQYINRKKRFTWGVVAGHVPLRSALYLGFSQDVIDINGTAVPVVKEEYDLLRLFQDQVGLLGAWPFSTTLRLEGNLSTTYQYYRIDRYSDYYQDNGIFNYLFSDREKVALEDANYNFRLDRDFIHNAGVALVGDNSYFGVTSPLAGHRFRVGISKYVGGYNFEAITLDGRKYFWLKPISLAFRAMHYARTGEDADSFFPIFVGQQGLVRGYNLTGSVSELEREYNLSIDQLLGSKIAIANFEVRLPFSGPRRLALIPSNLFYSDLNFFVDGGVAFSDYDAVNFDLNDPTQFDQSAVVYSMGLSLRVNLFGLLLEPYYAKPLRKDASAGFGMNFLFGGF